MSQHSSDQEFAGGRIQGDTQIWVGPSNALLSQARDASCDRLAAGAQHCGDLAPAAEPAQADLPADDEAEEQDERGVLSGQRALRFHAPPEFLVQPLNDIRGPQRLPLVLRELEEGEQLLATLLAAPDHPRAARAPLPLEGGEGRAGRAGAVRVDDAVEVRPDLRQGVLRGLPLEVAQLVHGTTLDQSLRPDQANRLPEAGMAVNHAPDGGDQTSVPQVGEARPPGLEGLAPGTKLQRHELLLPIG